jgi:hypothetical protein
VFVDHRRNLGRIPNDSESELKIDCPHHVRGISFDRGIEDIAAPAPANPSSVVSSSARRSLRTMSSAECCFRPAIRFIVYYRCASEIAPIVDMLGARGVGDRLPRPVQAVLLAVRPIVGQHSLFHDTVDLTPMLVPTGASARRDGDLTDDVIHAIDRMP